MVYGIAGGIGSGKSYVCKIIELLGVPVFDSDKEAKYLYTSDETLKSELVARYGKSIYNDDNSLNKSKLASIIFSDEVELKLVNDMVHPRLRKRFKLWVEEQTSKGYNNVVIESALMFNSSLHKLTDKVILITAPLEKRIKRAMMRDNTTRDNVISRINKQLSQEEQIKLSDYIIDNSGDCLVLPQLCKILLPT